MSKPVISAFRVYDVLVALDDGADVSDLGFGVEERAALRKAMRHGYLRPARFAQGNNVRPAIVAYAVTPEGRDFIDRVEAMETEAIRRSREPDAAGTRS